MTTATRKKVRAGNSNVEVWHEGGRIYVQWPGACSPVWFERDDLREIVQWLDRLADRGSVLCNHGRGGRVEAFVADGRLTAYGDPSPNWEQFKAALALDGPEYE